MYVNCYQYNNSVGLPPISKICLPRQTHPGTVYLTSIEMPTVLESMLCVTSFISIFFIMVKTMVWITSYLSLDNAMLSMMFFVNKCIRTAAFVSSLMVCHLSYAKKICSGFILPAIFTVYLILFTDFFM